MPVTSEDGQPRIYTTSEAAERLGLSARRVRRLAVSRGVGRRVHARLLLFTDADLDALRVRTPGRPRAAHRAQAPDQ